LYINKGCKVIGCEGKHKAKGFCDKHYRQYLHHGRLAPEREYLKLTKCCITDCNKPYHALGFCLAHYKRFIEGKSITEAIQERPGRKSNKLCSIEGCNKKHYAKGYCVNHYMYFKHHNML